MKRFYREVTIAEADGGWRVLLDARPIKTMGSRAQIVPTRALAEALADEWAGQGETIDPAGFVLRDLADYAIDVVRLERDRVIGAVLTFGETDTLCYRADPDEPLHRRQREVWEPLLAEAERRWGVRFERVSGIIHWPQRPGTLAKLRSVLGALDPFTLAALQTLASLTASLVVALAAIEPRSDAESLWAASELEEEWQAALWGREAEAEHRRARRFAAFTAAVRFSRLVSAEP
ncbi:MAG: ATP12 family protein [Novosphingobium sp.]